MRVLWSPVMASPDDLQFQGNYASDMSHLVLVFLSLWFNLNSARFQSLRKPQISCLQILELQPSASPAPALQCPLEKLKWICQTMKTTSKRVQRWAAEQYGQISSQVAAYFTCLLFYSQWDKPDCLLFPQLLAGEKQTGGFWTFEYYQSFFNVDTVQVHCFLTSCILYNSCIILKIWVRSHWCAGQFDPH